MNYNNRLSSVLDSNCLYLHSTWENPEVVDEHTGHKGDNDPIDVMEIGYRVAKRGEVLQVKVLGCIALIDEGETDWKIISIDKNDPLADSMKDITDVEKYFPGLMKATVEWLRIYKLPDGKPENTFAFNGEFKDRNFALKIIQETHKHWTGLVQKDAESRNISCANSTLPDNQYTISQAEADAVINKAPSFSQGEPPEDSGAVSGSGCQPEVPRLNIVPPSGRSSVRCTLKQFRRPIDELWLADAIATDHLMTRNTTTGPMPQRRRRAVRTGVLQKSRVLAPPALKALLLLTSSASHLLGRSRL
ncbi:hypothetical protein AAG570_006978 [Ranatra chinensis]|uniref:inorganic diphosphatase n=1 Tax=Ranatra chinensis TaxID=642074 RepID=A0ABD0YW98_9HEMI